MNRQINDEVYVKDFTPKHKLCLGKITGLWEVQGEPIKYIVHFTGSDGSDCGGTFAEDDLYDQSLPEENASVPFKFDIGDDVWYWYVDDGSRRVWYGLVEGFTEAGEVKVCYDSFIDLTENDDSPYVVRFTVPAEQVFETRLEAVVDAALHYQEELDKDVAEWLQREEEGKLKWQARSSPKAPDTPFKFLQGDRVCSVIPYASGTILDMVEGTVHAEPQSDNPKWFCLSTQDGLTMAPIAFTATTPEEAAKLYADNKVKLLMDIWKQHKEVAAKKLEAMLNR